MTTTTLDLIEELAALRAALAEVRRQRDDSDTARAEQARDKATIAALRADLAEARRAASNARYTARTSRAEVRALTAKLRAAHATIGRLLDAIAATGGIPDATRGQR